MYYSTLAILFIVGLFFGILLCIYLGRRYANWQGTSTQEKKQQSL